MPCDYGYDGAKVEYYLIFSSPIDLLIILKFLKYPISKGYKTFHPKTS